MYCGYVIKRTPKPRCSYRMKYFECHFDGKCDLQVEGIDINKRRK